MALLKISEPGKSQDPHEKKYYIDEMDDIYRDYMTQQYIISSCDRIYNIA